MIFLFYKGIIYSEHMLDVEQVLGQPYTVC